MMVMDMSSREGSGVPTGNSDSQPDAPIDNPDDSERPAEGDTALSNFDLNELTSAQVDLTDGIPEEKLDEIDKEDKDSFAM